MIGALECGLPQLALRQFASAKCPLWIKALAEVANGCNARWPVLPPCPGHLVVDQYAGAALGTKPRASYGAAITERPPVPAPGALL